MRDSSSAQRRVEPTESLFPDTEGPSFFMRPTPLVPPPSHELRDFGRERLGLHKSGTHPLMRPSSRPTVGPGDLPPFPDSFSLAPVDALDEPHAASRVRATAPPLSPIAIEAPTRRRRNVRRVITRGLFLLVIGGLLGLFGDALASRLADPLHQLRARIAVVAATR